MPFALLAVLLVMLAVGAVFAIFWMGAGRYERGGSLADI